MSGFSPQQLEAMLNAVEARKRLTTPAISTEVIPFPTPSASERESQALAQPSSNPITSFEPSQVAKPVPAARPPKRPDPIEDAFPELAAKRQAPLPKGAKNVKFHDVIRGEDGRISGVRTYELEEPSDEPELPLEPGPSTA